MTQMVTDRENLRFRAATVMTATVAGVLLATCVGGRSEEFVREIITLEYSLLPVAGTNVHAAGAEAISHEVSLLPAASAGEEAEEALSREVAIVEPTAATPAPVTQLAVTVTPTGNEATLNWGGYDELGERDVAFYEIYVSSSPFTDVSTMTPYTNVSAGQFRLVIEDLTPWVDRYFAVVAVDALGGATVQVAPVAVFVLAPEVITCEFSILPVAAADGVASEAVSREACVVSATPQPPAPVTGLAVTTTTVGDEAELRWDGYDELGQKDVVRYDIYVADGHFDDVSGMDPRTNVPAGQFTVTLAGLAPWQDRCFAVVAVDALGGFHTAVQSLSAYVLAPEVVSQEASFLAVAEAHADTMELASREVAAVMPDSAVPEAVSYPGSPFSAQTSASQYRAIDLRWSQYDELAQKDVMRYRIYVDVSRFSDVSKMTPWASVPAGVFTYTVTGLDERATYAVAVAAEDILGQFNPVVHSVYADSSAAQVFLVDTRAWLQGAYDGVRSEMRTDVNASLPLVSPYAEDSLRVSSVQTDVVDWVLGVLTDTNGRPVAAQSAWLKANGAVVSPGHTQMLWKVAQGDRRHVILKHRNHLAAMSATPILFSASTNAYDFTAAPDKVAGGTNACVELAPGVWGMIAGDCDGDGKVTAVDRAVVSNQMGKTGYLVGDLNLDGEVTGEDVP